MGVRKRGKRQCPRPDKRIFHNRITAETEAKRMERTGYGRIYSYRCPCGKWHVSGQNRR